MTGRSPPLVKEAAFLVEEADERARLFTPQIRHNSDQLRRAQFDRGCEAEGDRGESGVSGKGGDLLFQGVPLSRLALTHRVVALLRWGGAASSRAPRDCLSRLELTNPAMLRGYPFMESV